MKFASLIGITLLFASFNTLAAVFKCVDAEGKQSYQQQPCPKTAAESKVTVDADWTLVKYDTYLSGAPKDVGAYRRVMFKQSHAGDNLGAKPTLGYVYYDCAKKSIAGPYYRMRYAHEQKLELGQIEDGLFTGSSELYSFDNYKRPYDHQQPWGEPEFVAFACAGAAPVAVAAAPAVSGPASGVYAVKPEGITISEVRFDGDRVIVSGGADSNATVAMFMRNLESAGYANASLITINGSDFKLSARNK